MASKGLTKEIILNTAVACIEESGNPEVSLHEIARRLNIKAPSLYNHIRNNQELKKMVLEYGVNKLYEKLKNNISDKVKDEAVIAFSKTYYSFAIENKGLYLSIMSIPSCNDEEVNKMALIILNLITEVLSTYNLSSDAIIHFQRVLRAILDGFIAEQNLGYFYFFSDADIEVSKHVAMQCFLDSVNKEASKERN